MSPTPPILGRRNFLGAALAAPVAWDVLTPDDQPGAVLRFHDDTVTTFRTDFRQPMRLQRGHPGRLPARPLNDPGFTWISGYVHASPSPGAPAYIPPGRPAPSFSWLSSELAVYPNADAITASGYSPFSYVNGQLCITAAPTPNAVRRLIPNGFSTAYVSGALSSYPYSQTYGIFEITARIPAGRGLWPAFWLLPADLSWPPENDVMEVLGHDTSTVYTTLHSKRFDKGTMHGHVTATVDLAAAMHRYTVDWGPQRVRYYLDRRLIFSQPTPADWHQAFYLLTNLAVGGPHSWPGAPDASTGFPARLYIAGIQAWQRRDYGGGLGN